MAVAKTTEWQKFVLEDAKKQTALMDRQRVARLARDAAAPPVVVEVKPARARARKKAVG